MEAWMKCGAMAVTILCASTTASAQAAYPLIAVATGDSAADYLGGTVDTIGDLNADGVRDIVATSISGINAQAGTVRVLSGADGASLGDILAPSIMSFATIARAVDDVTGDGIEDILVGAPFHSGSLVGQGGAFVYSGVALAGAPVLSIIGAAANAGLGRALDRIGDVNSDGVGDFAIATSTQGGAITVYSGATGSVVYVVQNVAGSSGGFIRGLPDLDGDMVEDVAVADTNNGFVSVLSGAIGATIWSVQAGFGAGRAVSPVGDIDADGVVDVAIGDAAGNLNGVVRVYSGVNGNQIYSVIGSQPALAGTGFGFSISRSADFDGDGDDEYLVGSPSANGFSRGVVHLVHAANGSVECSLNGMVGDRYGYALADHPDVDGDGVADAVIGAPRASGFGQVQITRFANITGNWTGTGEDLRLRTSVNGLLEACPDNKWFS